MVHREILGLQQQSATYGRERWYSPTLYGNQDVADKLEQLLQKVVGVLNVKANPITGRILVNFNPKKFTERIRTLLERGLILSSLDQITDEDIQAAHDATSDKGMAANLKTQAINLISGNSSQNAHEMFRLIKESETPGSTSKRPVTLSVANTFLKITGPMVLGLIVVCGVTGGLPIAAIPIVGKVKALADPAAQIAALTAVYFSTSAVQGTVEYKRKNAWENYANEVATNMEKETLEHFHKMDMADLDKMSNSQVIGRINADSEKVAEFISHVPHSMIERGLTFAIGTGLLLVISPVSFIVSLAPVPVLYYMSKKKGKQIGQDFQKKGESHGLAQGVILDNVNGLSTVRNFTAEEREINRFGQASQNHIDDSRTATESANWLTGFGQFSLSWGTAAAVIHSSTEVLRGAMSFASLSILSGLLPPMIMSTQGINREMEMYQKAISASTGILDLRDIQPKIVDGPIELNTQDCKGEIVFGNVEFHYRSDTPFISGLDLCIEAGKTTAFVGGTGSGKTTLVKLLSRFYDIQSGHISLDGNPINEITLASLRQQMSIISQDSFLFQASIMENIRYGRPDASDEEVMEAARHSQALDFIEALPQQFNTVIGEHGKTLSGGQRQRISIARAILKDAPILILDEATSAVDNKTEENLQTAVALVSKGKTTIVIAHRLSTIRNADQIYVIDNGRVLEQGSHNELLTQKGNYAELWGLQTRKDDVAA